MADQVVGCAWFGRSDAIAGHRSLPATLTLSERAGSASSNGDAKAETPRRYVTQEVHGDNRGVQSRAVRHTHGRRPR